ncbi:MAG: polymer-forming cytoskeletal protein, partial [Desulfotignum sp.]|nr:polymer-forming cytoskeletal protein [Desulfotignum sp.]
GTVTLESEAEVSGSIHSESSVTVGWDSEVEGSVFAKGAVTLEGDARVSGSIHSESPVTLGWQDTVEGDVISEGSIDMSGGKNLIDGNAAASGQITLGWKSKITGTQSEFDPDPGVISPEPPQTCPEVSAPSQSIFSAGTTDMSFGWKQDGIIEPGNYRDLSAGGKNKLYFKRNAPGQCEYVFNSISLAWDVDIYLDLSQCEENGEPGDITIFSEDDIDFGGKMEIYIITEDGSEQKMKDVDPEVAKRIYWETYDDFSQGSSSEWFGTILAGDDISFDSTGMEMIGAAASVNGTVTMGSSADVTYIPANYAVENW